MSRHVKRAVCHVGFPQRHTPIAPRSALLLGGGGARVPWGPLPRLVPASRLAAGALFRRLPTGERDPALLLRAEELRAPPPLRCDATRTCEVQRRVLVYGGRDEQEAAAHRTSRSGARSGEARRSAQEARRARGGRRAGSANRGRQRLGRRGACCRSAMPRLWRVGYPGGGARRDRGERRQASSRRPPTLPALRSTPRGLLPAGDHARELNPSGFGRSTIRRIARSRRSMSRSAARRPRPQCHRLTFTDVMRQSPRSRRDSEMAIARYAAPATGRAVTNGAARRVESLLRPASSRRSRARSAAR